MSLFSDLARVNDEQDFDVVVHLVEVHVEPFDVEVVLQLIDDCPRLLPLLPHASHHRIGGHAEKGQGTENAHDGFVGRHHAGNRARDVVFEKTLAVWRQERDGLLLIEQADRQAHVKAFPVGEHLALDTIQLCRVFGIRVRLRVILFDNDLAAGRLAILGQQILDPLCISLEIDAFG